MTVDIRKADVELLERLSDAAIRAGHTQTATEGYALALRLRVELGLLSDGWFTDAIEGDRMTTRNVTAEPLDPRERFGLYRLCDCPTCEGKGTAPWHTSRAPVRCPDCRGEGRVRQEVASCESPEAVGVALVTLAREGEFEECPLGLLDRIPECKDCEGRGHHADSRECLTCQGTGDKPSGTWLILPWLPSPRNASDAGKLLRSRRS